YREILSLSPEDEGAQQALREIYTERAEWKELGKLLHEVIETFAGTPREPILRLELGRLLEEKLDNREEAGRELERGLAADRSNRDLLAALARLYESLGAWEKLIETLKRRAGAEHGGLAQALCEIGRIYDEKLSELVKAREAYEQAVHLDPTRRD